MSALLWHALLYLVAGLAALLTWLAIAILTLFPPARRYLWAWLAWTIAGAIARLLVLQGRLEARARPPARDAAPQDLGSAAREREVRS